MNTIFAAILAAALVIQAPVLTYTQGNVKPFVTTSIPADATFICIEYASLDQPGYTPSKCLNFRAGQLSSFENDWSMVNCTIDQVLANDVYCGDGKEWDVRTYTESPDPNSRTYSNIVRVVYPKPVLVIR